MKHLLLNVPNRRSEAMRVSWIMAIAAMLLISPGLVGAEDLFIGTWKLNVEKSRFRSGPASRSDTLTIERAGDGVRVTIDGVNSRRVAFRINYTANFDGRRYPHVDTSPQSPPGLAVAVTRMDERALERTTYLGDKKLTTVKWVVSEDGQLMTATETGMDAKRQTYNNVSVYERQ